MFPLRAEVKVDSTKATQISFSPLSTHYALVFEDSIIIQNNFDFSNPHVFQFSLNSADLHNHGDDIWFQWISDTSFAFGNYRGKIYLFDSFSKDHSITYNIESLIISAFSAYEYLGILTNSSKIFFFKDRQLYSQIDIEQSNLKSSQFYFSKSLLFLQSDGQFYFAEITKPMIESKSQLEFHKFLIENSTIISFNPNSQSVAYSNSQRQLFLLSNINCPSNQESLIYQTDNDIINLFWINNFSQICIIERNYQISILDISHTFITPIQFLSFEVLSIDFDERNKKLVYLTGDSIVSIPFAFITSPFCYISTSLYTLFNTKKIASTINESTSQFNEIAILPPEISPISKIAESNSNEIAIYGGNCIVVLTEKELFLTHIDNFTSMIWCNDKLYVFTTSKSTSSLIIYSRELNLIATIPSPHEATTVSTSFLNDRILISNRNFFTVFDFDINNIVERPKSSRFMSSLVESDEFTVSTTTFKVQETIINAICGFHGDIWLHLKSNAKCKANYIFNDLENLNIDTFVLNFNSNQVIDSNVDRIWSNIRPKFILLETNYKYKFFFSDNSAFFEFKKKNSFNLHLNSIYINETDFGFSKSDSELPILFQPFDYLIPLLHNELSKRKTSSCFALLKSMISMKEFNHIISQFFIYSFQSGHLSDFIKILSLFDIDQISSILSILDNQIKDVISSTCMFNNVNENNVIDALLFLLFDVDFQMNLLVNMTPDMFVQVIDSFCHKTITAKGDFYVSKLIHKLLNSMEWSKLIRLVNLVSIEHQIAVDLPLELVHLNELNSFSISQVFGIIERDHKKWLDYENNKRKENDNTMCQNEIIKSLGISFIAADLYRWSISCFAIANDKEKCKILIMDKPDIASEIQKYIKEKGENTFCLFLESLFNEMNLYKT